MIYNCIKYVHNCEDHSYFVFIPAVLIYDLFLIHLSHVSRVEVTEGPNVRDQIVSCAFSSILVEDSIQS